MKLSANTFADRRYLVAVLAAFIFVVGFVVVAVVLAGRVGTSTGAVSAQDDDQSMAEKSRAQAAPRIGSVDVRRRAAAAAAAEQSLGGAASADEQANGDTPDADASGPAPIRPVYNGEYDLVTTVEWTLSDSKQKSPGVTSTSPAGSLTTGRVIEAVAEGVVNGKPVKATFVVALTSFHASDSPPPGSSPGRHYLTGSWRLLPPKSSADARSLAVVRGSLGGEFGFDPLESGRDIAVTVDVLGNQVVGSRAARKGEYVGSPKFDGTLVLPEGQDLNALASKMMGEER